MLFEFCSNACNCLVTMTQNVHIRLASQRIDNTIVGTSEVPRLYTPGEIITCRSGFMRWVYARMFGYNFVF